MTISSAACRSDGCHSPEYHGASQDCSSHFLWQNVFCFQIPRSIICMKTVIFFREIVIMTYFCCNNYSGKLQWEGKNLWYLSKFPQAEIQIKIFFVIHLQIDELISSFKLNVFHWVGFSHRHKTNCRCFFLRCQWLVHKIVTIAKVLRDRSKNNNLYA